MAVSWLITARPSIQTTFEQLGSCEAAYKVVDELEKPASTKPPVSVAVSFAIERNIPPFFDATSSCGTQPAGGTALTLGHSWSGSVEHFGIFRGPKSMMNSKDANAANAANAASAAAAADDDDDDDDPDPYPSTDADSDTETETDTDTDSDTDENNDKDDTSGCAMTRIAIVLLVMFACTARAMIELDTTS